MGALLADSGGCTRFAIEIRGRRLRRYPLEQTSYIHTYIRDRKRGGGRGEAYYH
jgi:hypothetical protein